MENLAQKLEAVLLDCLYKPEEVAFGEVPEDAVVVESITSKFGFHPGRIAAHSEEIRGFCDEMAAGFQLSGGGGHSFLNLCVDKDGHQWGEHRDCDNLLALAIGAGQGGFCMPRELWDILPGGMPYVYFGTAEAPDNAEIGPLTNDLTAPAT